MGKCITLSAGLLAVAIGVAAAEPVTVRNDAVLRAGPDASFSVIGHLPIGTKMEMTNCTAGWCQVDFNGIAGFVGATDLGNAGAVRRSPRSTVENVQRIRTRVNHRSAAASSSTSSAPLGEGGATSKHALSPSAPQPAHP
jgi:Bacterial SH3 domain